MSFFSNLLLLEKKDYDESGNYIHNRGQEYDYIVVVRFKPDIKRFLINCEDFRGLKELLTNLDLKSDIPCVCSKKKL